MMIEITRPERVLYYLLPGRLVCDDSNNFNRCFSKCKITKSVFISVQMLKKQNLGLESLRWSNYLVKPSITTVSCGFLYR